MAQQPPIYAKKSRQRMIIHLGTVLRGNDLICSPLVPLNDGGEKVYTRPLPAAKRIFPTWRARRLL
jgi:hypothetical protein